MLGKGVAAGVAGDMVASSMGTAVLLSGVYKLGRSASAGVPVLVDMAVAEGAPRGSVEDVLRAVA